MAGTSDSTPDRRPCSTCHQPVIGGRYHELCRPRVIKELGRVPKAYEGWWLEQFRQLPMLLSDAEGERQVLAIVEAARERRSSVSATPVEARSARAARTSIRLKVAENQYVVRWIGRKPYVYQRTYQGVVRHSRPRQRDEYRGRLPLEVAKLGPEAIRTAIANGCLLKPTSQRRLSRR